MHRTVAVVLAQFNEITNNQTHSSSVTTDQVADPRHDLSAASISSQRETLLASAENQQQSNFLDNLNPRTWVNRGIDFVAEKGYETIQHHVGADAAEAFKTGMDFLKRINNFDVEVAKGMIEGMLSQGKEFGLAMKFIEFNWKYEQGQLPAGQHKFEAFYNYLKETNSTGLLEGMTDSQAFEQSVGRFGGQMVGGILKSPVDTAFALNASKLYLDYAKNRHSGMDMVEAGGKLTNRQIASTVAQGALDIAMLGLGNTVIGQGDEAVPALQALFKQNPAVKAELLEIFTETVAQSGITVAQMEGASPDEIAQAVAMQSVTTLGLNGFMRWANSLQSKAPDADVTIRPDEPDLEVNTRTGGMELDADRPPTSSLSSQTTQLPELDPDQPLSMDDFVPVGDQFQAGNVTLSQTGEAVATIPGGTLEGTLADLQGEAVLQVAPGLVVDTQSSSLILGDGSRVPLEYGATPTTLEGATALPVVIEGGEGLVLQDGRVSFMTQDGEYTPPGTISKWGDESVIATSTNGIAGVHFRDGRVSSGPLDGSSPFAQPLPNGRLTQLNGKPGVQSESGSVVSLSGEQGIRVRQADGSYSDPLSGNVSILNGGMVVEMPLENSDLSLAFGDNGVMMVKGYSGRYSAPIGTTKTPPDFDWTADGRLQVPLRDGNVAVVDLDGSVERMTTAQVKQLEVDNQPFSDADTATELEKMKQRVASKVKTYNPQEYLDPTEADFRSFQRNLSDDQQANISQEDLRRLYDSAAPDPHFTGRPSPELLGGTIEAARHFARMNPDAQVHYTQLLVPANMGALNKTFGAQRVDEFAQGLAELDQAFIDEIEGLGGTVTLVQGRGSEVHVVTTGVDGATLETALSNWSNSVERFWDKPFTSTEGKEVLVSSLPHPKGSPDESFGAPLKHSTPVDLSESQPKIADLLQNGDAEISAQQPAPVVTPEFTGDLSAENLAQLGEANIYLQRLRRQQRTQDTILPPPGHNERQAFVQQAGELGIDEKTAATMFDGSRRTFDHRTGMYNRSALDETLLNAREAIMTRPGTKAIAVEIDVGNIGGLNNAVGRDTTDGLLAAPSRLLEINFRETGVEVTTVRAGGDEFVYVAVGGADLQQKVDAALLKTKQQVDAINAMKVEGTEKTIGDVKNPKYANDPAKRGLGLYWGTASLTPTSTPEGVRQLTGSRVELMKKGKQ